MLFRSVNCHLAAHQKEVAARNLDCLTILKRGDFKPVSNECCTFESETTGTRILVLMSSLKTSSSLSHYIYHHHHLNTSSSSEYIIHLNTSFIFKDHSHIFWFGDMNYRIDMDVKSVKEACLAQNYQFLQKHDQLLRQFTDNLGFALADFEEGTLNFQPTFKYDLSSDKYDTSEKQRIPAWCDRVI